MIEPTGGARSASRPLPARRGQGFQLPTPRPAEPTEHVRSSQRTPRLEGLLVQQLLKESKLFPAGDSRAPLAESLLADQITEQLFRESDA